MALRSSPPESFAIYEDEQPLPTPEDSYIASDELDDNNASFDTMPRSSSPLPPMEASHRLSMPSRHISAHSVAPSAISAMPSECDFISKPPSPIATQCNRTSYRNTSNMTRRLQMSSPPPFSPPLEGRRGFKFDMPKREMTPGLRGMEGSMKARGLVREGGSPLHPDRRSRQGSVVDAQEPQTPTKREQQSPLVLLHVTLLPLRLQYDLSVMEKGLPVHILEQFRALEEKLNDDVLMRRGMLITHPKDEYEILEERVLEGLELKTPRVWKCGHFHGGDEEDGSEILDHDHLDETQDEALRKHTRTESTDSEATNHLCGHCDAPLKPDNEGISTGKARWDVKVYAANGLMRAGTWSAAWSEMERVDVQISPWLSTEMKVALEAGKRRMEDDEERRVQEVVREQMQGEIEELRRACGDLQVQREREVAAAIEKEQIEMQRLDALKRSHEEAEQQAHQLLTASRTNSSRPSSSHGRATSAQIPLSTLLRNYLYLQAKDQRNIALLVMSIIVIFLLTGRGRTLPPPTMPTASLAPSIADFPLCRQPAPAMQPIESGFSDTASAPPPVATNYASAQTASIIEDTQTMTSPSWTADELSTTTTKHSARLDESGIAEASSFASEATVFLDTIEKASAVKDVEALEEVPAIDPIEASVSEVDEMDGEVMQEL